MTGPRVSVLITAFNREEFVAEAMESALASSLTDIELVVVDDCSEDATWEVITSTARLDSRIKVFRNEENLGDNRNRNRAATYATGTYLKYLDSDDALYPYALEAFVVPMEQFPEAGFGLSEIPSGTRRSPYVISPREAYQEHFFTNDLFGRAPGSSIIRRSAFTAVGGFRDFVGRGQLGDLELWLKLARTFSMVRLPRDLVWDRQHNNQESAYQRKAPFDRIRTERALYREALSALDCPLSAAEREGALSRLEKLDARHFLREAILNRNPMRAFQFGKAVAIRPSAILRALVPVT